MQISGPSKWLNKLKRPQGPGQLVPPSTSYTLPPPLLYPHLIAFYFSNIYYYRILKRYPNAKMHVRWPRCTSDTTHMYIYKIGYIHIHIYIYSIYSNILLSCTMREWCQGTRCDAPDTDTPWNNTLSFVPLYPFCVYPFFIIPFWHLPPLRVNGFRHGFGYAFECYTICNLSLVIVEIYPSDKGQRVYSWHLIH